MEEQGTSGLTADFRTAQRRSQQTDPAASRLLAEGQSGLKAAGREGRVRQAGGEGAGI